MTKPIQKVCPLYNHLGFLAITRLDFIVYFYHYSPQDVGTDEYRSNYSIHIGQHYTPFDGIETDDRIRSNNGYYAISWIEDGRIEVFDVIDKGDVTTFTLNLQNGATKYN